MKKLLNKLSSAIVMIAAILAIAPGCRKSVTPITPSPVVYKNHIVFIYKSDTTDAAGYRDLMKNYSCEVTLLERANVVGFDFSPFDLIVVGHNTSLSTIPDWTTAMADAINNSNKPLLLCGDGGGRLLNKFSLQVKQSTCSYNYHLTAVTVSDPSNIIYNSPRAITIPANQKLEIFSINAGSLSFQKSPLNTYPNLEVLGGEPGNSEYYTITTENNRYAFFGYFYNAEYMTSAGKDLMVNLSFNIGKLKQ